VARLAKSAPFRSHFGAIQRKRGILGRHSEDFRKGNGVTRAQLIFSGLSVAAAFLTLGVFGLRLALRLDLWQWWVPLALLGGIAAADLASGLIHWAADTWGESDLPVIGHRLLVPFRLHHLHPDDLARRGFVETNGDTALLSASVLPCLLLVPIEEAWWGGPVAVGGLALSGAGMMTNQIHQWAHVRLPPRPIRALQAWGLLLGRAEHAVHHERPYDAHYCITTGWCNRPAEAIDLFRRLEAVVTWLTGARPRDDERRYARCAGVESPPSGARHGQSAW
jgi:ubiquitin-conjugating enzyme E2 variant